MAWCFSTRTSVATVLTTHPCVSRCLRVKMVSHKCYGISDLWQLAYLFKNLLRLVTCHDCVISLRLSDAYVCISKLTDHHWFRQWFVTWPVPSHYLNQCWNIVNYTRKNKLQWNFNRNQYIFVQENAFENAEWKMAAILSWPLYVIFGSPNQVLVDLYNEMIQN